jgi:hypothetical protein
MGNILAVSYVYINRGRMFYASTTNNNLLNINVSSTSRDNN